MQIDTSVIDINSETIDCWAYVEIFGHRQLVGRVSTRKLGIQMMLQIDVPDMDTGFSHSELYSPSSIFSLTPTTEDWCRSYAKSRAQYGHQVLPYIPNVKQLTTTVNNDGPGDEPGDGYNGDGM